MTPRRRQHNCWFCNHKRAVRILFRAVPVTILVVALTLIAAYVREHYAMWATGALISERMLNLIGELVADHILFE